MRSHLAAALALAWITVVAHAATLTLIVAVPGNTPAGDTVYVAGSFQGWNPGSPAHALARQPDGRWQITLNLPDNQRIEFKFTRGSWPRVEKGPSGEEIPNRVHTAVGTQTLNLAVASWADLPVSTVTGNVTTFTYAPFLGGRRVWVYLPPGYDADGPERYPVLYMHDGQNLFDQSTSFAGEWRVDEACQAFINGGEIEPIIVVGIDNGPARITEYTPFSSGGSGGGGDAYLRAVRDVLMPEIARRYRVQVGPRNTFMSGSSLGGLISAYAGYTFADTWGRVAPVSPSYWWAGARMLTYAAQTGRPAALDRLYQDMGTIETGGTQDGNGNGVDDNIDLLRGMRDIALAQGFVLGDSLLSVEAAGHTHSEFYWAQRFPNLLRSLIDPPTPINRDLDASGGVDYFDLLRLLEGGAGADLNEDGVVDTDDVRLTVQAVTPP